MLLHLRDELMSLDHLRSLLQKALRRKLDDDIVRAAAALTRYSVVERKNGNAYKNHIIDPGKVLTYTFEDAAM